MTDRELLRNYLEGGSEAAFQDLVRRHIDLVYGAALRGLGDADTAQEITQNVFIALARKALWLRGEANLAGWLYRTTALEVRQWWRGELRRKRREQTAVELGTTMKDEDALLKSMAGLLDEGLMQLRDSDRQVLLLRYFEERSHREIGTLLGAREDAVRKRIDKALEKLTEFFRRRGHAVPAAATTAAALRAAAQAAPSGLAAAAAHAALSAGGAGTVTGLSLLLSTLMGLTKTQTALLCVLLAGAPVAYQSHVLARAREHRTALENRLDETTQTQQDLEKVQGETQARLARADVALASLRAEAGRQRAVAAEIRTNLYAWSDRSDYVRVPKGLIKELILSESTVNPYAFRGIHHRHQEPVATADGALSPVLQEALAITPAEAAQIKAVYQGVATEFEALAQAHQYETNKPTSYDAGLPHSRTFLTTAFPQEGAALRDRLQQAGVDVLGSERSAAVWEQASGALEDRFNSFGTNELFQTVFWGDWGVAYGRMFRQPGSQYGLGASVTSHGWENAAELFPEDLRGILPSPPAHPSTPATLNQHE